MSLANAFQRQSYNVIVFEMIVLVLFVGVIDFVTGYQVSFFMFYGPPIFFTAWFCDKKTALLVAFFPASPGGGPISLPVIPICTTGMRRGKW